MDQEFLYPDVEEIVDTGRGADGLSQAMGMNAILSSANPLAALKKALAAGYQTDPATMTDGNALRIQSLEPTLKNLTFNEQSTTIANDVLKDKKKAESTVEEYSTIDDIGEAFTYEEAGLPATENDAYARAFELVKYVGAVGQVSNVILSTRNLVNARTREEKSKMLAIKRKLNNLIYFGNASYVATEPNGILRRVQAFTPALTDNIIDLKGKRPTLEQFNVGVNVIENVAGYTTNLRLYLSPTARRDYKNELLKDKRYLVGGDLKAEVEGLKSNSLVYDGGEMPMRKDMFLNPRKYPRRNKADDAFIATGSTPPNAPTITSATPTADAASTVPAGTYDYAVVAVNKFGHKSAPTVTEDVLVAVGQNVTFVLADAGSPSGQEATAFEIYRRDGASTAPKDYRYLFTVGTVEGKKDDGSWMPDTGFMFMIEWDTDQVLAYHQLLDAAIFPLGAVADAVRWLQRLYGTPIIYNPKRIVVFKNVGSEPN